MTQSVIGPALAPALHAAYPARVTETSDLPTGFPPVLDLPMVWAGAQFVDQSEYIHTLSESDLQEAESALQQFKGTTRLSMGGGSDPVANTKIALGLDGDLVSRDNFPLPNLGLRLDKIRRDVYDGKGFGVVRGLDPQKYCVEDLTVLHLGIQSYIATRHGRQDKKGNMLGQFVLCSRWFRC